MALAECKDANCVEHGLAKWAGSYVLIWTPHLNTKSRAKGSICKQQPGSLHAAAPAQEL